MKWLYSTVWHAPDVGVKGIELPRITTLQIVEVFLVEIRAVPLAVREGMRPTGSQTCTSVYNRRSRRVCRQLQRGMCPLWNFEGVAAGGAGVLHAGTGGGAQGGGGARGRGYRGARRRRREKVPCTPYRPILKPQALHLKSLTLDPGPFTRHPQPHNLSTRWSERGA
jgi:hypothetical protein